MQQLSDRRHRQPRGDDCLRLPERGFKQLGKLAWLRKGTPLPQTLTHHFNSVPSNVISAAKRCGETRLGDWFGGPKGVELDEEVVGLGNYGFTLTVLSSEAELTLPDEEEDEEAALERSWTQSSPTADNETLGTNRRCCLVLATTVS